MAGYSHTRPVLPRRNCGNDRNGFYLENWENTFCNFMFLKKVLVLEVIKTIDGKYKDDFVRERGLRATSPDVWNMNLWSHSTVPVSIQLRWSSNSGSVIKKGFNFLCPEDLFVGTFNILPRGLPSQPPAAPPLPADNLPGLASISVKLYGEERGERRENKTCPAKSDLSQEHDDTTPHRTAQRKREIDEIKCKN